MTKLPLKLLILMMVLWSSSLMAQGFTISKSSIKIDREFVKAPVFAVNRTYGKVDKQNDSRWLQFLVSYTPASTGSNVVWEDDLSAELIVLLPAKKGKGYGNVVMFTGKQVLYSVPGDKNTHYLLFLIPPVVLSKYTSFVKYDNRTLDTTVFAAVIFRRGSNNQVIATGYAPMKNRTDSEVAKLFEQYYSSKFRVMKVEDGILPKDKSPWQWIDTDHFDLPKSMMEGKK
jgi:hypothetical protein